MKSTGLNLEINLKNNKVYRNLDLEIELEDLRVIGDALSDKVMLEKLQGKKRTAAIRLLGQVSRVIKTVESADKGAVSRAKRRKW